MNLRLIIIGILLVAAPSALLGQAENVPVRNPVYLFLDRMESRGILTKYFDAILPLSRSEVAMHLSTIAAAESSLSREEKEFLSDYLYA